MDIAARKAKAADPLAVEADADAETVVRQVLRRQLSSAPRSSAKTAGDR